MSRLFRDVRFATDTTEIPHPDVPILKFTTTPEFGEISSLYAHPYCVAQMISGLFKVDITINHGEGSPGNDVDKYLAMMPALRPLVLVLKTLMTKHGLQNPASYGMSSYAIACMCIYFLKVRRLPPSGRYAL
jgi:non-canonical poly(A) RNA polymerase PAPD5/7